MKGLAEVYARELARRMDDDIMGVLLARPTHKPKPLTRWQKVKRFMTKKRYPGRWLTYKLMKHYDIYEGDY